jgi:hypothetical protein
MHFHYEEIPRHVAVTVVMCVPHRVYRVARAIFWRTFHHDGKISPAWWGWRVQALPLSLYLPSPAKLWCTPQLRGQILFSPTISPLSLYSSVVYPTCNYAMATAMRGWKFTVKCSFLQFFIKKIIVSVQEIQIQSMTIWFQSWKRANRNYIFGVTN